RRRPPGTRTAPRLAERDDHSLVCQRIMGTLLRRFLVLIALMFWQGGFTFYAGVVVPVGQHVLGHHEQSQVTRPVSDYINLAGGITLLLLAWDTAVTADASAGRRWGRWLSWLVMVGALVLLVWLHLRLDEMMDADGYQGVQRHAFRLEHRLYLWISTIQW